MNIDELDAKIYELNLTELLDCHATGDYGSLRYRIKGLRDSLGWDIIAITGLNGPDTYYRPGAKHLRDWLDANNVEGAVGSADMMFDYATSTFYYTELIPMDEIPETYASPRRPLHRRRSAVMDSVPPISSKG